VVRVVPHHLCGKKKKKRGKAHRVGRRGRETGLISKEKKNRPARLSRQKKRGVRPRQEGEMVTTGGKRAAVLKKGGEDGRLHWGGEDKKKKEKDDTTLYKEFKKSTLPVGKAGKGGEYDPLRTKCAVRGGGGGGEHPDPVG